MTKGTTSSGLRHIKTHTLCRRCGRKTFHKQKKQCSSCGFPEAKMRFYNWSLKVRRRRGYGTGRLRYEGTLDRRFKNGFREGKKPKDRTKHVKA